MLRVGPRLDRGRSSTRVAPALQRMGFVRDKNRSPLLWVLERPTASIAQRILPNVRRLPDLWCQCILSFADSSPIARVLARAVHDLQALVPTCALGPTHSAGLTGPARRCGVFFARTRKRTAHGVCLLPKKDKKADGTRRVPATKDRREFSEFFARTSIRSPTLALALQCRCSIRLMNPQNNKEQSRWQAANLTAS